MHLFKKEVPGLSCAKKNILLVFTSLVLVPTTMPALTTTPEGKNEIYLAHSN